MILRKIINFLTPTKCKTDKLYYILNNKLKIEDVKYLSVAGYTNGDPDGYPDDAYVLINKIDRNFSNINHKHYGYWRTGMMVFNYIEIINGKCTIGTEFR